jgi:hypothetical protein
VIIEPVSIVFQENPGRLGLMQGAPLCASTSARRILAYFLLDIFELILLGDPY